MSNESPSFGTELSQEIMTCLFIPHGTTLNTSDGIRIPKGKQVSSIATSIRKLNCMYRTLKLLWRCFKVHALSTLALYTLKIRFMNLFQVVVVDLKE